MNCGRLRDMVVKDFAEFGELTIIATSLGQILILSNRAVYEGAVLDACLVSQFAISAEPRLTSLVAWNVDAESPQQQVSNTSVIHEDTQEPSKKKSKRSKWELKK